MYGLTDSWAQVPETNENNNVKGPVNVEWHAPTPQPDLVIQSLTPSDYYPMAGESISVTLVIENLGNDDAGIFWTDLFLNLTSPPTVPSSGDYYCLRSLMAGERDSCTFTGITSTSPDTWHMYGLTDSEGRISESNEDNNVRGPVDVYWQGSQEKPDLIVEDFCIGNNDPEVGDSVHVMVTIKNQGSVDVPGNFFSSLFYNRSSPPTPPDPGDVYVWSVPLAPGETSSYSFYIGNDEAEDWSMWFLVDSYASIEESDEDNNLYGPEYVSWFYPTKDSPITRDQIMSNAEDYANVTWECRAQNAASTPRCSAWSCDYEVGEHYQGVPYLWGGDRKVETFQNNLVNGFRAGAHDENDCLEGNAGLIGNACWATGVDCSGFVSRCWGLPKYGTWTLLDHSYDIRYDQLMRGDALDKPGDHVVLLSRRLSYDTLEIYEARSYGAPPPDPHSNLVQERKYPESYFKINDYLAIRYNEITGDPPLVPGDCNGDQVVNTADVVFLQNYLFAGGPPPNPLCIADVTDNGVVDIADTVYLVTYLFAGGPPPKDGCD
jgi:hypothetical protein